MSAATVQLDAGGLLPAKTKVDADATEQIVARAYHHPALGSRAVVRLASDRLGQAEDLAMEFLGFGAPAVSPPLALQQRRSLGFAAWALINDPKNARYALDLVKRMKAAARQARSKPGHAWDSYTEMAKNLGRSARHFLPPFWEEAGRAFKDLGNQTYAGRALNKSLEAERVHALESDRARRRDVVLEFVLSGCLAGSALSEYGTDLQSQYPPAEAFAIFRDLCLRRTRGGMAPWATMPKDFARLAKAASLNGDQELEKWLEEVIEAPAMGRAPYQFWKTCSSHCQRIVARNPAFAVALLRHTRPEARYYGDSKLGPWFELLEEWGVLDYLWEDGHRGAPPLGEPIADWFSRIVCDQVPVPTRTLAMLAQLTPRLKSENKPLALSVTRRWGGGTDIDVDVLEACLAQGIAVADPPSDFSVTFTGWLTATVDHPFRNQDIVLAQDEPRFAEEVATGLGQALTCRGGTTERGYRQAAQDQRPFPAAAADRPGITKLWRQHTVTVLDQLENTGLASFETARAQLEATLWPDTLRLFPDLAERLNGIDPVAMVQRTLQAGVFDEYGLPALERLVDEDKITVQAHEYRESNLHLAFPTVVVSDKVHAYAVHSDGKIKQHELRLPKKAELARIIPIGDDLVVSYRDERYQGHFFWTSDPVQKYECGYHYGNSNDAAVTLLPDGSAFLGQHAVRPGDKEPPGSQSYYHDGVRFWRLTGEYDQATRAHQWRIVELDPQTGKEGRASVPPWFEDTEGGTLDAVNSELLPAPVGAENSPLGVKDGMLGWKAVERREEGYFGQGIDGRRWDKPLPAVPVGLLRQPGADAYLPLTTTGGSENHSLWDPSGTTIVAQLQAFSSDFAYGQVTLLPLLFWHLLKVRDEKSSQKLRGIGHEQCAALLQAAAEDREAGKQRGRGSPTPEERLTRLVPALKKLLPTAPSRMHLGIAQLLERAERECLAFTDLRDQANANSTKATQGAASAAYHLSDSGAAHWGMDAFYTYGADNTSVSGHLAAAAAFLKGESKGGELPRTNYVWFSLLEDLPLRCWQTLWRATAARMARQDEADTPWLEFLKHWHASGLAELPGQFDLMTGHPEGVKKKQWGGFDLDLNAGTSFTIHNGDDRFIIVECDSHSADQPPYRFLRYSTGKAPAPPPGYVVKNVQKIKNRHEAGQIAAFVAAVESSTARPLPTKEELAELAGRLSASPAEIGLIWLGGLNLDTYQSNFLPGDLRNALGMKTTEASAGRQALRNLNSTVLAQLYEAVVAAGCHAPFAPDRWPVLHAIEKVWLAKMPKRLQIDAALQKRLSALGSSSRWHRANHEELLGVAAEPTKHPLLQPRDAEIAVHKDRNYNSLELAAKNKNEQLLSNGFLRSIVQLVSLVYAETPTGHPARAGMPALIKQTAKLLDQASTLLDLRALHLYGDERKTLSPTEWLNKHVGKTKPHPKDGTARFDDGLIVAAALDSQHQVVIAFRPAKLKDDADMARLHGILAVGIPDEDDVREDILATIAAVRSPGLQKLAKALAVKGGPAGQWRQDPRQSASDVVKGMQKKLKLSEAGAVLYAQVLALPDPTAANVCAWNGWTAAPLKKAATELVNGKLVLEATRARAGRSIFLPGEWSDLKAPWLPVETWKLAHLVDLDLNRRELCPVGGPLVLRPFEDLFAAAWQRVLDGDAPRYEEVQRRKRGK